MRVSLFDYRLPADRIAQKPRPRGSSRLLVLDRRSGAISHRLFADLPQLLRPGDLLVRNDVGVLPARLYGRDAEGRLVEIFLLEALDPECRRWLALARPGRRAKERRIVRFDEGIEAAIKEVREDGKRVVQFERPLEHALLERIGHVPLPPYIRRPAGAPDRPEDREAYETVFAKEPLAIAAPTAGLHFTLEMLAHIRSRGVGVSDLTLAIGSGTFKPVIAEETEDHWLDPEEVFLPAATLSLLQKTKDSGGRILAVGTTVTRALEAVSRTPEGFGGAGDLRFATDLFIFPGFEFRAVDLLLTNFHLPRSTLLMLACAFGGREKVLAAYAEAIQEGYLFYSFGDAMFIS